jgi:hypothetical protein
MKKTFLLLMLISILLESHVFAQRKDVISDESKVPAYTLPDVLTQFNGKKIKSAKAWNKQRAEILNIFADQVYGKVPGKMGISEVKVWETSDEALDGLARRKQLSLFFKKDQRNLEVNVLMYLPKTTETVP